MRLTNTHVPLCEASFRHIKHELISKISQSEYIFVCCYSISDLDFLDALAPTEGAAVITDAKQWDCLDHERRHELLSRIERLPACSTLFEYYGEKLGVRYDRLRQNPLFGIPYEPAMHNKFIVFCELDKTELEEQCYEDAKWTNVVVEPSFSARAVWIGSYNFTANAPNNLESALYLEHRDLAEGFLRYWNEIYKICKPILT